MRASITLIFLFLVSITFAQTIRRVNGDPTVTGVNVYHSLQEAHDAGTAGDVLIVEPGNGASVGSLTCNKTLTIYGRGNESYPGYASVPSGTAAVGHITVNANNVKISGLYLSNYDITINGVTGVVISRNYFRDLYINGLASAPANNITITQNWLTSYVYILGNATGAVSNVTISNNYFEGFVTKNNLCSGILVNQNVIGTVMNTGFTLYNSTFMNNIFRASQNIPFSTGNTSFFYNAFTSTSTLDSGMGSNNQFVANLSSQYNSGYQVVSGSVLKTASNTGGEVGMYGGATPFVDYYIPAVPAVTKLRSDGVGNNTTDIKLTVSAKSNN